MKYIYNVYVFLFGRKCFSMLNKFLFMISLRGLGILNFQGKETGENWFIKKYVASDESIVVFDVGANVGNFSTEIKRYCRNAKIFAFEPHPINFRKLLNVGGIHQYNLALGSKEMDLDLFDYSGVLDGSAHASLYKDVIESIHCAESTPHQVKCIRLDDFCEKNAVGVIHFLKIDTEGNEYDVLLGAKRMIEENRIKVIQIEFNEMNVVSRVFMRDFFSLLDKYVLYRLLPKGLLPLKYSPLGCEIFAYQNIVAISRVSG